jgi:hypothetical protein
MKTINLIAAMFFSAALPGPALKIMNKLNVKKKCSRGSIGLCAIAALAGALLATTAGVASADYGQGAIYQIELVAQERGGGGAWLWIALYPDYTGDYAGSDCAGGNNRLFHGEGAAADRGDATWSYASCTIDPTGTCVVIEGVRLNGFGTDCPGCPIYTTITVPSTYGNYSAATGDAYMTWPFFIYPLGPSFSQLQVAP